MKSEELKRRHALLDEHHLRYNDDAAGLLEELAKLGFPLEAVGELYNKDMAYREIVGVLASWLPKISNIIVREDIVRALSVKWAKKYGQALVEEFRRSDGFAEDALQWAAGSALEVVASKTIADEMIAIAQDKRYGKSREMVTWGMRKLKGRDRRARLA